MYLHNLGFDVIIMCQLLQHRAENQTISTVDSNSILYFRAVKVRCINSPGGVITMIGDVLCQQVTASDICSRECYSVGIKTLTCAMKVDKVVLLKLAVFCR